jgi:methionyl-tRNA formyltransferase
MNKIAIIGCKHTTKDLIVGLQRYGIKVDHCITISPEKGNEQKVAGYSNLQKFLVKEGISFTIAPHYSLKSESCEQLIKDLNIDLLLVMGWQRLIPDWLLNSLEFGAFGMHGSNKPLPHGRGRSPMNWSLIQNKDLFFTHLFKYLPGVDDGPVVGCQKFDINVHDDCHTLHFKNTISMIKLCAKYIPKILNETASLTSQPKEGECYFPKRSAEDGIIHWNESTTNIYNLVRAVTAPFPGAYTYHGDAEISIMRVIPFDTRINYDEYRPGEIVEVFYNGYFVVKTGDSTILVTKYFGLDIKPSSIGVRLHANGIPVKNWENLPT